KGDEDRFPLLKGLDKVNCVAMSRDGVLVAVGCDDSTVRIHRAKAAMQQQSLQDRPKLDGVLFSPDARHLVTATNDPEEARTPGLWDVETGRLVARRTGHYGRLTAMTFSPDGRHLVTAGTDSSVRVWRADSGEVVHVLRTSGPVSWVDVSRDGERIAAA